MNYTKERKGYLATVPVDRPVTTMEEAKSAELLSWCAERLAEGMHWDELRKRLGLGPAAVDERWRAIRRALISQAEVSTDNEEYLSKTEIIHDALLQAQDLLKKIDHQIEYGEKSKNHHTFFRYKNDVIRTIKDIAEKAYDQHLESKKIRMSTQGKFTGVQINFYSNIPRPTKVIQKKVEELTEGYQKLVEAQKE